MSRIQDFQDIIGVQFQNPRLLQQALTHRSYLNEQLNEVLKDNERMEFLGDAVL
ncbi:MAG: ribonuclease III, partial [Anaerolineae bacterium]|nr:ribonuclease III [Anaerolineae bacterium]